MSGRKAAPPAGDPEEMRRVAVEDVFDALEHTLCAMGGTLDDVVVLAKEQAKILRAIISRMDAIEGKLEALAKRIPERLPIDGRGRH